MLCAVMLSATPFGVWAQAGGWQVVAAENGAVLTPGMNNVSRQLTDIAVGDAGGGLYGLRVTNPTAQEGYWALRAGAFTRYAQVNVTGAAGPGRGGADSAHVFLGLNAGWGGAAPDGQRVIAGRAGDPAATLNATYGVWRWDGTRNIEIARGSTDGALGPNLGANWVFPNNASLAQARMLDGGAVLIHAEVTSPGGASSRLIARHVPGVGNQPCMRTAATEAALAPGLSAGDSFTNIAGGLDRIGIASGTRIYAKLPASNAREGIWQLCDGAPRAIAVDDEPGQRGPDIGSNTAVFQDFGTGAPQPSGAQGVVFFADWREPPASSRTGLFRHNGGTNRGIAYTEATGYYGPNWSNATWRAFAANSLSVAGDYVAFSAGLDTADGGDPTGLWRVRAGDRPQLIALIGLTGAPYEPEANRTWRTFDAIAVLANGDVVLEATTNPDATKDLWFLKNGRAPRRLLSVGQTLQVATTQGTVSTTVTSLDVPDDGAHYADGSDTWVAADGTVIATVGTASQGRLVIATRLTVPHPDATFVDSFE